MKLPLWTDIWTTELGDRSVSITHCPCRSTGGLHVCPVWVLQTCRALQVSTGEVSIQKGRSQSTWPRTENSFQASLVKNRCFLLKEATWCEKFHERGSVPHKIKVRQSEMTDWNTFDKPDTLPLMRTSFPSYQDIQLCVLTGKKLI